MVASVFKIGIDFDDVLFSSAIRTIDLYNARYGTAATLDDWYDLRPETLLKFGVGDAKELIQRIVEINASDDFQMVSPIAEAQTVLRRLKDQGHHLQIVTGRPEALRALTAALVDKHYPGIFDSSAIQFTDHFQAGNGPALTKGDVAARLELTHFIDDVIVHVDSIAEKGIKAILLDGYKWNQGPSTDGVVRVSSWQQIGEYFDDKQFQGK